MQCNHKDFEPRYFGWFTHLYDVKTDVDLLPKIRNHLLEGEVFKNGSEDEHMQEKSWVETYNFMTAMVRDYPEYLPNTYLNIRSM